MTGKSPKNGWWKWSTPKDLDPPYVFKPHHGRFSFLAQPSGSACDESIFPKESIGRQPLGFALETWLVEVLWMGNGSVSLLVWVGSRYGLVFLHSRNVIKGHTSSLKSEIGQSCDSIHSPFPPKFFKPCPSKSGISQWRPPVAPRTLWRPPPWNPPWRMPIWPANSRHFGLVQLGVSRSWFPEKRGQMWKDDMMTLGKSSVSTHTCGTFDLLLLFRLHLQVGSAKSDKINYTLAQKVFHSGDVPHEVGMEGMVGWNCRGLEGRNDMRRNMSALTCLDGGWSDILTYLDISWLWGCFGRFGLGNWNFLPRSPPSTMTVSENGLPGVGFQTSSAEKEAAEYPGHREKGLAAWQCLTGCPRPAGVPKSWEKFQGLYDAVTCSPPNF